jgi:hypothetical protein
VCIQRQYPVRVCGQQAIKPAVQAVGPLRATSAAQLANALRHFRDGDCGQKKFFVVGLQPGTQRGGHQGFAPWRQSGEDEYLK